MRHRRDYADVSGLNNAPSNVGFLGMEPPALLRPDKAMRGLAIALGGLLGWFALSAADALMRLMFGHGLS